MLTVPCRIPPGLWPPALRKTMRVINMIMSDFERVSIESLHFDGNLILYQYNGRLEKKVTTE